MADSHVYGSETRTYEHVLRLSTPQMNRLRYLIGVEIREMQERYDGELDMLLDLERQLDAIWAGRA